MRPLGIPVVAAALAAASFSSAPIASTAPSGHTIPTSLAAPPPAAPAAQTDAAVGLESLWAPGFLLEDRNGDGFLDLVDAAFQLPPAPSDVEIAAAANIAARLGFETASMDLPLARATGAPAGAPRIVLGRDALRAAGIPAGDFDGLEPGIGVIAVRDAPRRDVIVAGGDDAGTAAAALAMAARLPHLASPQGPALDDVIDAITAALGTGGIEPATIRVPRLQVVAGEARADRLDIELTVAAGQGADAQRLLEQLAARPAGDTSERGRGPGGRGTASGDPQAEEVPAAAPATEAPTLRFDGLRLLRVQIDDGGAPRVVWVENAEQARPAGGRRPGGGDKGELDLSNLYGNDGFFSDTDGNLIPDRIDVLLTASGDAAAASADLAARLGLEAAGVTLPIAAVAADIEDPDSAPPLVLIGATHPLVQRLVEEGKLVGPDLAAGEGWIEVVRKAFADRTALVIVGADSAGTERAVRQVAERFPYLWPRGKDRPTVEEVEDDLWRAISARSPIGQAATALYKLDTMAAKLDGLDLERVSVGVHVEKADPGLEAFLRARAAELFAADAIEVSVDDLDVQHGKTIIDDELDIPSEVDAFWERFRGAVIPGVRRGDEVRLRAFLSEPPEVRADVAAQAQRQLVAAGAADSSRVTVLSAYKPGYSWLYDDVRPRLEDRDVAAIDIRFAEVGAPEAWPQQAMYTPTRWLLEIFPIDEVLARDLGLDLEQISFEKMPKDAPAYEVVVTDPAGNEILRESFDPHWVLRDYFDRFPDYEKARVTTGWIHAEAGGRTLIDQRIVTDLERFWDHFQGDTLMRIYDYVMRIGEGKPSASDAPYFGELRVDVSLSEPDYQIGVDKEQIASMEALHEEIYFGTLHFFDLLGRMARGQELSYPGRVIPIVRPKADGEAGHAHITFTGFDAIHPEVVVAYTERGKRPQEMKRAIPEVTIDRPQPLAARVRAGAEGLDSLGFYVKVDFEQDRRDEFARRTSVESIDARITNAEQTAAVIAGADALRGAGLYSSALAFAGLSALDLTVGWERERSVETERLASLSANGVPAALPDIGAWLPADDGWRGRPLVQWDTPMPPDEAYRVLAEMQTFPQATAYQVGHSYLGKPIWVLDMMAPLPGSHWSQAKATTLKPTVIYSARQHANEVSSTSHVLKLAEMILTDPAYAEVLDKVNVVVHPITNPDGAQLAYDLHQITPDHMLHAGYLGSLGVDVTSGQGSTDPMYPETNVRPKLWETWLPDLFLNPHGYPSHEWVQVFSEYAAWVRSRASEQRGWWGMRGWFMPSFSYLDDPRYPHHKDAAFEILDRITEKINGADEIRALNRRAYDRYRRYAFAWDQENFKVDFTDDVLIYLPIKGGTGGGRGGMSNPRVTVWSGTTEAPDETAYGDWMKLVATGGLQWDEALLEYLLEGNHVVERDEQAFAGGVTMSLDRPRPPRPADDSGAEQ